jgi:hypothetical protein
MMQTFTFSRTMGKDTKPGFLFVATAIPHATLPSHLLFVPRDNAALSYEIYESNSIGAQVAWMTLYTYDVIRLILNSDFFLAPDADCLLDYLDRVGYEEPPISDSISNANTQQGLLEYDQ